MKDIKTKILGTWNLYKVDKNGKVQDQNDQEYTFLDTGYLSCAVIRDGSYIPDNYPRFWDIESEDNKLILLKNKRRDSEILTIDSNFLILRSLIYDNTVYHYKKS